MLAVTVDGANYLAWHNIILINYMPIADGTFVGDEDIHFVSSQNGTW